MKSNLVWKRGYELTSTFPENRKETWTSPTGTLIDISVRFGKHTNLFDFKQNSVAGFNDQVGKCRNLVDSYLRQESNLEVVENCPLCNAGVSDTEPDIVIHDMMYLRCTNCDFHYLKCRLNENASNEFYAKDEVLSAAITNKEQTQARVKEIVTPKVEWIAREFEKKHGRKPKKIVDVGAGGGHFTYAARQLGYETVGIEPNEPSARYCKEVFGVELEQVDFLDYAKTCTDADIVTFWAVLEHVPSFMTFLKAARGMFKTGEGMIVAEVPRWESFDSIVQKHFADSVNRHLFPVSHIQIFSDSSLANAFMMNNFIPCSAWYFGMDMFEFTMQLARSTGNDRLIEEMGKSLLAMQPVLDQAMLSDTMVFAGIPT